MAAPATAVAALRAATACDHDAVDARFGRYDLADMAQYGAFLRAHAGALPGVEAALAGSRHLPRLRPRAALIASDLAALGQAMPEAPSCEAPADAAEAFGMAYVVEGSRLGGMLLARSLPEGCPKAYLSAAHLPGEWRAFLQALDEAAIDEDWIARAIAAAKRTFARYAAVADRA